MLRVLMLLAGLLAAAAVQAQEQLRFGSGATHDTSSESSYGWELDYAEGLTEHSYATLGWVNEGHQLNHHRDGFVSQLWAHTDLLEQRMSLAAGLGPYVYFDTSRDQPHPFFAPYEDGHGITLIFSAEITWYLGQSWLTYLRANRIHVEGQVASMFLLGLGYQFDGRSSPGTGATPASPASLTGGLDDEVSLFVGRTELNSFESESSNAFALEYRHRLSRHVDWTLGWLNEEGNEFIRRNGITAQMWVMRPLLDDRLELGIGAGAYVVVNQQDQTFTRVHQQTIAMPSDDDRLSGIVTLTAAYDFSPRWSARFSFNRLVTNYDRDADVILLGAGYRF